MYKEMITEEGLKEIYVFILKEFPWVFDDDYILADDLEYIGQSLMEGKEKIIGSSSDLILDPAWIKRKQKRISEW